MNLALIVVFAGMATGLAVVVVLVLGGHDPFFGLNAGFVALVVNFAIATLATCLIPGDNRTRRIPAAAHAA